MNRALFITACLLSSLAVAKADSSLVAEWTSFGDTGSSSTGGLSMTYNSATASNGELSVDASSGYSGLPSVDLSSLGLTSSTGFTISIQLSDYTALGNLSNTNTGGTFFSVSSSSSSGANYLSVGTSTSTTTVKACYNGSSSSFSSSSGSSFSLSGTTIITVVASLNNDGYLQLEIYENGSLLATVTSSSIDEQDTLETLVLGGWSNSGNSLASETVSRLAVYSGSMTSEEVASLVTSWTATAPEPATASLSLLGLGALLLRRRRN